MTESAGAGIARLCELLRVLRHAAAAEGRRDDVDRLVERARLGQDPEPDLTSLARDLGLLSGVGAVRDAWPWDSGGHTAAEIYVCPAGRCARRWVRAPGRQVPRCELDAADLSKEDGD
jgi:hypothetical protein